MKKNLAKTKDSWQCGLIIFSVKHLELKNVKNYRYLSFFIEQLVN
jgi:hypothetical protein